LVQYVVCLLNSQLQFDNFCLQIKEEESVLDGILPKDFGKPEIVNNSGMLANLLDKKPELPQRHLVNGIGTVQKAGTVNHVLVNGAGGIKRPSSVEPNGDGNQVPPMKRPMLDCNGTMMANGPVNEADNGPIVKSDVNLGQAAFQNNNQPLQQQQQQPGIVLQQQQQQPGIVLQQQQQQQQQMTTTPGGQKIITGSDGKQYIVKTGPGCGNGTVIGTLTATPCTTPGMMQQQQQQQQAHQQQHPQQVNGNGGGQVLYAQNPQGGGKTIIILQPQAKVLTSSGQQVVVQNSTGGVQPQTLMVQNASGQTMMVQNSAGIQQQLVVQNSQQQVLVQNSASVQPHTLIRAVTTQQPTTLTYTTRPQMVTNVGPRPVVTQQQPQQQQQLQQQVPMQGLVRVSSPPVLQAPIQVPTPPPQTTPVAVAATPVVPTTPSVPVPKPDPSAPFLCEWHGCMKAFKSPKEVERHAIATHCPAGSDDIPCLWLRCDGMKRKRFSLMTHLQDRHCHPQVLFQS
jgi:AT-rich interactive domain-containing protein 2